MFQYAAARAFAEKWNAFVVIPFNTLLKRAFVLSNKTIFMDSLIVKKYVWHNKNNLFSLRKFNVNI